MISIANEVKAAEAVPVDKKPACKACCACPETKALRDACIMEKGAENCQDLIEAHKKCMREMGFNI
jgi:cytochrome c oxidase assembly protein subunit 17